MIPIVTLKSSLRAVLFLFTTILAAAHAAAADKPVLVVFVCEHGTVKSVVAAAQFNHLAKQRGIKAEAVARGINLESEIPAVVVTGLKKDGLAPLEMKPTAFSQADVDGAACIVAMCELPKKFAQNSNLSSWTDIPPVTVDYEKARTALVEHIGVLLDALAHR